MSTVMTLLNRLSLDTSDYKRGLDEAEQQTRSWTDTVGGILKSAGTVAAVGFGAAVAGVGAAMKMALDAAPVQGLRAAFQGLTGDADRMLARLREGAMGMVRDADLMRTYNQAAQLVGKTFADQLPQAMSCLSKVAAATGQEMGFLLDSLVKGVGRLSPMILDNLAIQVSLAEATDRASQMFGKQAEELSRAEVQAGMMAIVMEKLRANTARMPDVVGSAQQQWAALQATLANIKDSVGMAFLPMLQAVLGIVAGFAVEAAPNFISFCQSASSALSSTVIPALQNLGAAFFEAYALITGKGGDFSALFEYIASIAGNSAAQIVTDMVAMASGVGGVFANLQATAGSAWQQFSAIVQAGLQLVSSIWQQHGDEWLSIAQTAFGLILNTISTASESIGNAVQTTLRIVSYYWQEHGAEWLQTASNVMMAVATAIQTALNIAQRFWNEHGAQIMAIVQVVFEKVSLIITTIISQLVPWLGNQLMSMSVFFTQTFSSIAAFIGQVLPYIQRIIANALDLILRIWQNHGEQFLQTVTAAFNLARQVITTALQLIMGIVKTVLQALSGDWKGAWETLQTVLKTAWDNIGKVVDLGLKLVYNLCKTMLGVVYELFHNQIDQFVQAGRDIIEGLKRGIENAWGAVTAKVQELLNSLPDWARRLLGIGSPSRVFAALGICIPEGLAAGIEAGEGEAIKAVVQLVDDILSSARNIMENLATALPEPGVSVSDIIARLFGISREAAGAINRIWDKNLDFLNWLTTDVKNVMEKWLTALEPLSKLMGTARDMLELCRMQVGPLRTHAVSFLEFLQDTMRAIIQWLTPFGGGGTADWVVEQFSKAVTPLFERWARAIAPLQPLMAVAKSLFDLCAETARPLRTSAIDFLGFLFNTMQDIIEWLTPFGGGGTADWVIQQFQKSVTPLFERWAQAIQPVQPLLQLAKGLLESCATELGAVKTPAIAFLQFLFNITREINEWFNRSKDDLVLVIFQFEQVVQPWLERWSEALQPLQPLLNSVKGLLDIASNEVREVRLGIADFFDCALAVMDAVAAYLGQNLERTGSAIAGLAAYGQLLLDWKAALEPLQPVLSAVKSILDTASAETRSVLLSVDEFFNNVLLVMEQVTACLESNAARVDAAIAALKGQGDRLQGLKAALEPLAAVLPVIKGILDVAANKATDVELSVKTFFDNVIKVSTEVARYCAENAAAIDTAVAQLNEQKARMEAFRAALVPVQQLLKQIAEVIAGAESIASAELDAAFNEHLIPSIRSVRLGMENLYNVLVDMELEFLPDLTTRVNALRQTLVDVLNIISSMITARDTQGAEESILDEFAASVQDALRRVKTSLEVFHTWLDVDFRASLAALSFKSEAEGMIKTITDVMDAARTTLYNAGYAAGVQLGQGLVDGINSMLDAVRQAAQNLADAASDAISDALDIRSPSRVMFRFGQLAAEGFLRGWQWLDVQSGDWLDIPTLNGLLAARYNALTLRPMPATVATQPQIVNHFYLTAQYGYQRETSLAQDVRMLQMLYGGA